MPDVDSRLYTTVIREMIRHENDVTNHRIMWLLIVQGLIANASVTAGREHAEALPALAAVGILVTLSAFIILHKSYQARGYLQFLGNEAKRGTLRDEELPLLGWPGKRIKDWWRQVWPCPWLGHLGDLLEPFFFLPSLLILAWLFVLLQQWFRFGPAVLLVLSAILTAVMVSVLCLVWVWWQSKSGEEQRSEVHS
jgi:hypothetical protein